MSEVNQTRRAVVEILTADGRAGIPAVGNRSIHHYWQKLAPFFNEVLLAPQRRSDDRGMIWHWKEAVAARPPTGAMLASVRTRLAAAERRFEQESADDDKGGSDKKGNGKQLAVVVKKFVAKLIAASDSQLTAYVAQTDSGPMIHSWGAPEAGRPYFPDALECDVRGTVVVGEKDASGFEIVIENRKGDRIAQTRSDATGAFCFRKIGAGSYRVRVASGRINFPVSGVEVTVEHESVVGLQLHSTSINIEGQPKVATAHGFPSSVLTPEKTSAQPRRKRGAWVWAGAVSILIAGGGAWMWRSGSSSESSTPARAAFVNSTASGTVRADDESRASVGTGGATRTESSSTFGDGDTAPSKSEVGLADKYSPGNIDERGKNGAEREAARLGVSGPGSSETNSISRDDPRGRPTAALASEKKPRFSLSSPSAKAESPAPSRTADAAQLTAREKNAANKAPTSAGNPSGKANPAVVNATGTTKKPDAPVETETLSMDSDNQDSATPEKKPDGMAAATPRAKVAAKSNGTAKKKLGAGGESDAAAGVENDDDSASEGQALTPASDETAGSAGRPLTLPEPKRQRAPGARQAMAAGPEAGGSRDKLMAGAAAATVDPSATDSTVGGTKNKTPAKKSTSHSSEPETIAPEKEISADSSEPDATPDAENQDPTNLARTAKAKKTAANSLSSTIDSTTASTGANPDDSAAAEDGTKSDPNAATTAKKFAGQSPTPAQNSDAQTLDPAATGQTNTRSTSAATDEKGFARFRVRTSGWKSRLVQNMILPTEPVSDDQGDAVETLRARLLQEQAALMPQTLRRPEVWRGFSIQLPVNTTGIHWQDSSGAVPEGSLIAGDRAEIAFREGDLPGAGGCTLLDGSGHEIARLTTGSHGELSLTSASGVGRWYWIGVERAVADTTGPEARPDRFDWRLPRGRALPPSWRRDDHWRGGRGQRLEMPADDPEKNSTGFSLAFADRVTGWAIVSRLGLTVESAAGAE